jgi:hypothetical protein
MRRPGSRAPHTLVSSWHGLTIAVNHIDDAVTAHPCGAEAGGEGSARSGGMSMHVPMTVQQPPGGLTRGW